MKQLNEEKRTQLISNSRNAQKEKDGKTRYQKRVKSKVKANVSQLNRIDFNQLFKDNIMTVNLEVLGETNTYTVTISFGGFLDYLHKELEKANNVFSLRVVIRALLDAFNSDNVYIKCNCLYPDTKIKLLDGTNPTIAELTDRYNSGEKLYAYSVDEDGNFIPGEIDKVWQTGYSNEYIEVKLDNNYIIKTTPEHLFMLRDGSYCQAQSLQPNISLMPLYFDYHNNGYEAVKQNKGKGWKSVYKIVANYFKRTEIEQAKLRVNLATNKFKYDIAIHHADFNKNNNNPENLIPMTAEEHWSYHNSLAFPNKPVAMQENIRECSRLRAIERNTNPTPAMIELRKRFQEAGKLRNYDLDRRDQQALIMRESIINYWKNLSEDDLSLRKAEASDKMKAKWEAGCFNTEAYNQAAKKRGLDMHTPEREALSAAGVKKYWADISEDDKKRRAEISALNGKIGSQKGCRTRIQKIINYMLANNIEISFDNYNKYKGLRDPKIENHFKDIDEVISYYNLDDKYNHKIISVRRIKSESTPVYDIKMKGIPNFLTSAGVILHNCPDFLYRFAYYLSKDNIIAGNEKENRPSDITNPNNTLGRGCKHIMLVIGNTSWIIKLGSVVTNYYNYMEKHYKKLWADVIYPAVWDKKYEEPIQLDIDSIDDLDQLDTSTDMVDKSNIYARDKNKFKKGNTMGVRFAPKNSDEDDKNKNYSIFDKQKDIDSEEDSDIGEIE